MKEVYLKTTEVLHEKGYYILYNPHNKQYIVSSNAEETSFTKNMFRSKQFSAPHLTCADEHQQALLEGFEWREIKVTYEQFKVRND